MKLACECTQHNITMKDRHKKVNMNRCSLNIFNIIFLRSVDSGLLLLLPFEKNKKKI